MAEVSLAQWQDFLRIHPEAHFLQTGEWGELKSQFGWEPVRLVVGASGIQVLFRKLPLGLTVAYVPKPAPEQILESDAEQLGAELHALCRRRGAVLCKFEPDAWSTSQAILENPVLGAGRGRRNLVPSLHNVQPIRTLVVDVRSTEDSILARMRQKCRYNIRLAEKKGVQVRAWSDVAAFQAMLVTTGQRDQFSVHAPAYYRRAYDLFHPVGTCELLVAEYDGRPLSALMVFARGRRAWYLYGGSTEAERERMPNYALQWQAMRWAKNRGCEEYDLWGVPDEEQDALEAGFTDRSNGLWGVYRFKRGFGGELRRAEQAVDCVYKPLLYRLYLWRTSGREAQ